MEAHGQCWHRRACHAGHKRCFQCTAQASTSASPEKGQQHCRQLACMSWCTSWLTYLRSETDSFMRAVVSWAVKDTMR